MVEYREITGFPGYRIGNDGIVWSHWRRGPKPAVAAVARKIATRLRRNGYVDVGICRDGKQWRRYVHRLVLEAFVGQCPEGMQACHNNGNASDNRLENLRWDTVAANHADKLNHGTHQLGVKNHRAIINDDTAREIRRLHRTTGSPKTVAVMLGLSLDIVKGVVHQKSWSHVV